MTKDQLREELENQLDELYSLAWQDGNEGLNRRAELNKKFSGLLFAHLDKAVAEERLRNLAAAWNYIVRATKAESWGKDELASELEAKEEGK